MVCFTEVQCRKGGSTKGCEDKASMATEAQPSAGLESAIFGPPCRKLLGMFDKPQINEIPQVRAGEPDLFEFADFNSKIPSRAVQGFGVAGGFRQQVRSQIQLS